MSGNLARRRMLKFMPSDFRLQEAKQPPLKDHYDEWLARIVCYAFSVPVSPFVATVNRATGEMLRLQANQEALGPRARVKEASGTKIEQMLARLRGLGHNCLHWRWSGLRRCLAAHLKRQMPALV